MNIVFKKILGDPQAKHIKRLRKKVETINALAPKYQNLSPKQLQAQTDILKKRLKKETMKLI